MKIGIDYSSALAQKTGIGRFASDVIGEFKKTKDDFTFSLYRPKKNQDLKTPERIWWESVTLPKEAKRGKADLLYSPGFSCPPSKSIKKVVMVHDLIGMIYPGNASPAARFYWSYWLPHNVKNADVLIASSESTKKDILSLLRVDEKKVKRVYLAAREEFKKTDDKAALSSVLQKYGVKTPYLIAVSSLEPRKNHLNLLRAYLALGQKTRNEVSLVIIGKDAGTKPAIESFIRENALQANVHLIGYVSDEELVLLYSGALAYAAVSLYEGFGLTALEAMSCGLSGVVSNRSSLPEVAGKSALLVNPLNVQEMTEALNTLINDHSLRESLGKASSEQSKKFSIKKTAAEILNIFKECA